jgi:DNA (cytosine-5)-methyltransferase 1
MGLIVDLFAGGGGASLGIEMALGRPVDIAVNHDPKAIAMHQVNHPHTEHFIDNVWKAKPAEISRGRSVDVLWMSPDCTHFSKAKGAAPKRDPQRSKRSRGLAWVAIRWVDQVRPRLICLENVEEWQYWAPVLADGSPCPKRKGQTFRRWCAQMRSRGYKLEWWVDVRGCDHGSPTIRKRLVLVARCDGEPINRPRPTHGPALTGLRPYRTAAECIDWSIPCPSIFERKKPLADATMKRIARGIKRFVLDNPHPFIVPVTHRGDERVHSLEEPLRTITTAARGELALVTPYLAGCGGRAAQSPPKGVDLPFNTVTSKADQILVAPFVARCDHSSAAHKNGIHGMDQPTRTVTTSGAGALVTPFLAGVGGPSYSGKPRPLNAPMGTVLNENHTALVAPILTKFRGDNIGQRVDQPAPTVTANSFVKRPGGSVPIGLATAVLVNTRNGERDGQEPRARDVGEPYPTVTAHGSQGAVAAAFMAKHYGGHETDGAPLGEPLSTVTTQDHHHLVAASIVKLKGTSRDGQPITEPLDTVQTGGGRGGGHYALTNAFLTKYYSEGGTDAPITEPMHTATAKARFSLVATEAGTFPMTDEEIAGARKVAKFMAEYANDNRFNGVDFVCVKGIPIVDIGMRMLSLRELYRAQGFPDTYKIDPVVTRTLKNGRVVTGPLPKTDGTRMCGNSVSPYHAAAYVRANPLKPERARRAVAA